jgi:hypothetical protein
MMEEVQGGIPTGDEEEGHIDIDDNRPEDTKGDEHRIARRKEDHEDGDRVGEDIHGIPVVCTRGK